MNKKFIFLILFFFITSCYKNYLYVHHEKMDATSLASTHVDTPDPRLKHPPNGQMISVFWDFPLSIYRENLTLVTTVRFWDNKQDVFVYKIPRKRGYITYKFQDDTVAKNKRILTYKVDVLNEDRVLIDKWRHHFWKELIKINREEEFIIDEDIEMF